MCDCVMCWSFTFSNLTMVMSSFGSTSATSGWLSSLSWIPSLIESSGLNMYGLASTNWLISLRFMSSKLLQSITKCLSTDSAKSSALSTLLWRFCCPVLVQNKFFVCLV